MAISDAARCVAHTSRGERCKRARVRGATVCPTHGGSAPQVKAAAARRVAEAQAMEARASARAILGRNDVQPIEDPIRQLAAVAGEMVALKDVLGDVVADLRSWTTTDVFERKEIDARIAAYERSLDRVGRFLVEMSKLNLDERLVRLSEAQADKLEHVLDVVFALPELGLSKGQRKTAQEGVVRELHALAAAGA